MKFQAEGESVKGASEMDFVPVCVLDQSTR